MILLTNYDFKTGLSKKAILRVGQENHRNPGSDKKLIQVKLQDF
ncbi:hypothetical protein BH09BAC4_BH09BAC4_28830 [soil metagenome]